MFFIDPAEHAKPFLKKLIAAHNEAVGNGVGEFKAVVIGRHYACENVEAHPALRDRTEEFRCMLRGFGDEHSAIYTARYTGAELKEKFEFDPVGAQYSHVYDILWID